MAKDGSYAPLGTLLTAALAASPGSGPLAAEVSFSGGFTGYSGPLGQTTFFVQVGPGPWVLGPSVTAPQGSTDFAGVGSGEIFFRTFSSGVAFSRFGTPGVPSSFANALVFTPAADVDIGVCDELTIGSFSFTNGGWFGGYPDSFLSLSVTTHSSAPDLDGHTYTGRLQLNITAGCDRPSTCGTADRQEMAALNAGYFWIEGHPHPNPQAVGVHDNDFLPGNRATNIGAVDFRVKIGSLIPPGFTNPSSGALVLAEVPETQNLQIQPIANPLLSMISVTDEKNNQELFNSQGTIAVGATGKLTNLATLDDVTSGLVSNKGSLVNETGAQILNAGTIENQGVGLLESRGALSNYETLSNGAAAKVASSGTFENFCDLTSEGRFEDRGTLVNSFEARIENSGQFDNHSTLIDFSEVENTNSVSNLGSIVNQVGALLANFAYLSNDGALESQATITNDLSFGSSNLIRNTETGVIDNRYAMVMYGGGPTNAHLENDAGGGITNSGFFCVFDIEAGTSVEPVTARTCSAPASLGAHPG